MKWHDYPLLYRHCATAKGWRLKQDNEEEYVRQLQDMFRRTDKSGCRAGNNTAAHVSAELHWCRDDRPYYDLYPSVAEAFTKIDLDGVLCKDVTLPLPQLVIRFQVGRELVSHNGSRVRSIFAGHALAGCGTNGRGLLVAMDTGDMDTLGGEAPIPIHTLNCISLIDTETIEAQLENGRRHPYSDDKIDDCMVTACYKLVVALCLLKNNPDLIEPEPLEADRAKWEATHDPKYLERAAKRGKRAWSVGKHIEVAPGFRRPHFAIRWCGKGRVDPQLRPIKGCLVRRKAVEEVPTGYLGPLEELQEQSK